MFTKYYMYFLVFIILLTISCSTTMNNAQKTSIKETLQTPENTHPVLSLHATIINPSNGNVENIVNAGDIRLLKVFLKNLGDMRADNIRINVISSNPQCSLTPNSGEPLTIESQETIESDFWITVGKSYDDDKCTLQMLAYDLEGEELYRIEKIFEIKKTYAELKCEYELSESNGNGQLDQYEDANLILRVKNIGNISAEDVTVTTNDTDILFEVPPSNNDVGELSPKKEKKVKFKVVTNDNFISGGTMTLSFLVSGSNIESTVFLNIDIPLGLSGSKALFEEIKKNPDEKKCREYIDTYIDGEDIVEVREILELCIWNNAAQKKIIEAIEEYKTLYPDGQYISEADELIQAVNVDLDRNDWRLALRKRTKKSIQEYLNNYPDGAYKEEANVILIELEELNKVNEANTYKGYKKFIKNFPQYKKDNKIAEKATSEYWKKVLDENRQNIHFLCQTADALVGEMGQLYYNEAYSLYEEALELDAKACQAYLGLCYIDLEQNNYKKVIRNAELGIKESRYLGLFYLYMGRAYDALSNNENAIRYYNESLRYKDELDKETYIECLYQCALCHRRNLQNADAIEKFNVIIEIDSKSRYAVSARKYIDNLNK